MLHLSGTGQVVERQFSIVTDEPFFKDFGYVMEGNNEIDIDGRERVVDYLGSECSFGFCWGFIETFRGLRAGMTVIDKGDTHHLSVYRFHDHMPIRFTESLQWRINWSWERHFFNNPDWVKAHAEALARNGCWVDYATVHYWHQDAPGGYEHTPLQPIEQRTKSLLYSSRSPTDTPRPVRLDEF